MSFGHRRGYSKIRLPVARLSKARSQMMHIYVLAHHTSGASWETVAQLCHRNGWFAVRDCFILLKAWVGKLTAAMRIFKQDKYLTQKGVPRSPWSYVPRGCVCGQSGDKTRTGQRARGPIFLLVFVFVFVCV